MITYEKGDILGPNEDDIWTAGINVRGDGLRRKGFESTHWNGIECHGETKAIAEARRDAVLEGLKGR